MPRRLRKLVLYEQYHDMARKIAWQYWRSLPLATKFWVDPEDMMGEAILHIMNFVSKHYESDRASISTFLHCTVSSHMLNFALAQQNQKRFGWRRDLEDAAHVFKEEQAFRLFEAKQALETVYRKASPDLRKEIIVWFGPERRAPKWGVNARALTQEFAHLAKTHRLSVNDCSLLLRSGVWCS